MAVKTCLFCRKSPERMVSSLDGKVYICAACVSRASDILASNPVTNNPETLLNITALREHLDKFVIGQDDAKKALCVSLVNHHKRTTYELKSSDAIITKSNLLISGPSGSGKSLMLQTVARFLDLPFVSIDVTTLTQAGYIGQNIDTIVSRLLFAANGDIAKAERGIVFLDEIDKLAPRRATDTGGLEIQSALLRMVEGSKVVTQGNRPGVRGAEIDTTHVLFVAGGAFDGLDKVIESRLGAKGIGFNSNVGVSRSSEPHSEDFVKYGLIPELVGRFPHRTRTLQLTIEDMRKIVVNDSQSVLTDYRFLFDIDGIHLDFGDTFVDQVCQKALGEKIGARGIRTICDKILTPYLYAIPEFKAKKIKYIRFDDDSAEPYQSKKKP